MLIWGYEVQYPLKADKADYSQHDTSLRELVCFISLIKQLYILKSGT